MNHIPFLLSLETMATIGRSLQLLGLVLLPLSMVMELTGGLSRSFHLADMLKMMVFGILAFIIGRLLEGYARRPWRDKT